LAINKNVKKKIGLPRGLSYYEHGRLWANFFEQLGFDIVISSNTNKEILNNGVIFCTNETCLPVKVFHGHVLELKDKANYIFVPRYLSSNIDEYCCPKLCGLPDMVSLDLKEKLNIFEITINENFKKETYNSLKKAAKFLGVNYIKMRSVYDKTVGRYFIDNELSYLQAVPPLNKKKIAVLGHPYMIFDDYLSMNLINKLRKHGYFVCTHENVRPSVRREKSYPYNGKIKVFYSVGLDNLGSFYTFLDWENLCGIIYLTPFACGVDSIIIEFMERSLKDSKRIPFMKLTVDEHTGEAGFDTRIEAFLDMIV
jgi:predicted nucleotide-binding protein (sugar kinase/HSP70/actin superfamily)